LFTASLEGFASVKLCCSKIYMNNIACFVQIIRKEYIYS